MALWKNTLKPAQRAAWDAAMTNPAAEISADPAVQEAAARLDEARAEYSQARHEAAKRLFVAA